MSKIELPAKCRAVNSPHYGCLACDRRAEANHHLYTSIQGKNNSIELCNIHHFEIHKIGFEKFVQEYPDVFKILVHHRMACLTDLLPRSALTALTLRHLEGQDSYWILHLLVAQQAVAQ